MQQSSFWEADSRLAGQEIPRLIWNPKIGNKQYTTASNWASQI
jgi:hypothetical protein